MISTLFLLTGDICPNIRPFDVQIEGNYSLVRNVLHGGVLFIRQ